MKLTYKQYFDINFLDLTGRMMNLLNMYLVSLLLTRKSFAGKMSIAAFMEKHK